MKALVTLTWLSFLGAKPAFATALLTHAAPMAGFWGTATERCSILTAVSALSVPLWVSFSTWSQARIS